MNHACFRMPRESASQAREDAKGRVRDGQLLMVPCWPGHETYALVKGHLAAAQHHQLVQTGAHGRAVMRGLGGWLRRRNATTTSHV
jgi:ABC-type uncharacterized transport system YnjBCD substrate-binding protein